MLLKRVLDDAVILLPSLQRLVAVVLPTMLLKSLTDPLISWDNDTSLPTLSFTSPTIC